jgi:hypothetical protein
MASIKTIRDGIATRLQTITGLRVHTTTPGSISPPSAVITFESCDFDSSMSRGSDDLTFVVHVFTSLASDRAGEDALFSYIDGSGSKSVKAAVEGDGTLGGAAMFAVVTRARAPGIVDIGGVEYYGVQFDVTVGVAG